MLWYCQSTNKNSWDPSKDMRNFLQYFEIVMFLFHELSWNPQQSSVEPWLGNTSPQEEQQLLLNEMLDGTLWPREKCLFLPWIKFHFSHYSTCGLVANLSKLPFLYFNQTVAQSWNVTLDDSLGTRGAETGDYAYCPLGLVLLGKYQYLIALPCIFFSIIFGCP